MTSNKFSKKSGAKEKRYEAIIDAAEKILIKKGYENSTFSDFAEEAEYNKRTLYLYFPDKDDLFAAVILRILSKLHDHILKSITPEKLGRENVLEITKAHYSFFYINKAYYNLLWSFENKYFIYSKERDSSVNIKKCYYVREKNLDYIESVFRKGVKDNSILNVDDLHVEMTMLWAQTLGILQIISKGEQVLIDKHKINPNVLFDRHLNYMEKRLMKKC